VGSPMIDTRSATLAQIVADSLEQSLKAGVYTCGERLIEMTIAQEMNVSQNTVRDALRILEQDGWVYKRPRHGVTVRTFTPEEAEELYMLRATLEQLALRWMMEQVQQAEHMRLGNILSEARMQAGTGDTRGLREQLFKFHEQIATVPDRPQTAQLLVTMWNQVRLLENVRATHDPYDLNTYAEILTRYGELLTYIRYGECDAAHKLIYDIIMDDCRTLLPVLDLVL